MVNILRMYYILALCTTSIRRKKPYMSHLVYYSVIRFMSFSILTKSNRIKDILHLSMLHVLFGFNTFKNIYRFFNQFRKDDVEKIESICSFFFFYSFFIENCFFINIILKNMHVIRG